MVFFLKFKSWTLCYVVCFCCCNTSKFNLYHSCVVFFVVSLVVTMQEHCKQLIIHCARNQAFLIMMLMHFVLLFQTFHNTIIKYFIWKQHSCFAWSQFNCSLHMSVALLLNYKQPSLALCNIGTQYFAFFFLCYHHKKKFTTCQLGWSLPPSNPQPKNSPSHK
jgi:hypothetical protein